MTVRQFTHTFTIAADTDWHVVRADGLGVSGALLQGRYRLASGGTGGDCTVQLVTGPTPSTASSADVDALADDVVAYRETSITLAPSATASTRTNIQALVGDAGAWLQSPRVGSEVWAPLLAVKGDGTLAGSVTVVLVARPFAESGQ